MGGEIKPGQNLPSYGPAIAVHTSEAALALMLNVSMVVKMPILLCYLQAGIDRYHAIRNGQIWQNGFGIEPGRKINVVFTAVMFNNPVMKQHIQEAWSVFQENEKVT
jgi:hypothetical protein